jgi:hypothetical protein
MRGLEEQPENEAPRRQNWLKIAFVTPYFMVGHFHDFIRQILDSQSLDPHGSAQRVQHMHFYGLPSNCAPIPLMSFGSCTMSHP